MDSSVSERNISSSSRSLCLAISTKNGFAFIHRRRSSVNFKGGRHFCPKNMHENFPWLLLENFQNSQFFYYIFARKINQIPEFYMIFTPPPKKMPKFYIKIARKKYFSRFFGGTCHPTQVNAPRLNPSQKGWYWYSIKLPRTDGRLSWPRPWSREYICLLILLAVEIDKFARLHSLHIVQTRSYGSKFDWVCLLTRCFGVKTGRLATLLNIKFCRLFAYLKLWHYRFVFE